MTGLYDRLSSQIDDDTSGGLTPLDIAGLPQEQRQIMFFLLREKTASTQGVSLKMLQEHLAEIEDIPAILNELIRNNWLIELGEPPNTHYKVNLRPKRGSQLDSLWSSLTNRLFDDTEQT